MGAHNHFSSEKKMALNKCWAFCVCSKFYQPVAHGAMCVLLFRRKMIICNFHTTFADDADLTSIQLQLDQSYLARKWYEKHAIWSLNRVNLITFKEFISNHKTVEDNPGGLSGNNTKRIEGGARKVI